MPKRKRDVKVVSEDINNEEITRNLDNLINGDDYMLFYNYVEPWLKEQKTQGHYYLSQGQYFEWLRWITVKSITAYKKGKIYINLKVDNPIQITTAKNLKAILMALEEHSITGIFRIRPGKFYNIIKHIKDFKHSENIYTISNSQLLFYIKRKEKRSTPSNTSNMSNQTNNLKSNKKKRTKKKR